MSRGIGGLPGDRIAGRPVAVVIHPGCRPIPHLLIEVLRAPLESTQYTSIRYSNRLLDAGALASIGSVGDSYDNAMAESTIGSTRPNAPTAKAPGVASRTSNSPP